MFYEMFSKINSVARAPIQSFISVALSADNTVIWYDHWEDDYEFDILNATAHTTTTEIWGDGNAANGCAPDIQPCTDETDKLMSGDNVVIENIVTLPRDGSQIKYDGGDRLQASFPIALTRGAYPDRPGSLMAGATEVYSTQHWGKNFEAPVGDDIGVNAFQYSGLFFMAAYDNTVVTLPNATDITLNQGESAMVTVGQRDKLVSSAPIQVHLITGDRGSEYELRWFSLLPTESCK